MSRKRLRNFPPLRFIPANVNKFVEAVPTIKRIYDLPNKEESKIKQFFLKEKRIELDSDKIEVISLSEII